MRTNIIGKRAILAGVSIVAAALFATPGLLVIGYTTIGGSLGIATASNGYQRDVRVFNNFQDAAANNNLVPEPSYPGAFGAPLALWKAAAVWNSDSSGGKNFDFDWQGLATGVGGSSDNIVSSLSASCGGGTLAYCETPISNGWRIRFCEEWTWSDGPGQAGGGVDIQGVAAHELGHALGLGHSQSGNCSVACSQAPTMCPSICGDGTAQRTIQTDDINGLGAIYGTIPSNKPLITGISGSLTQGEVLTIHGSNFAATVSVKFTAGTGQNTGAIPGMVSNVPSFDGGTRIEVTIPFSARPGNVIVWHPGTRLSNPWPVAIGAVAPTLDSIFPESGQTRGGETIELSGSGFDTEGVTVTFGGAAASIVEATSTSLTVIAPAGTLEGEVVDVSVVQAGGAETLVAAYTYTANAIDLVLSGPTNIGGILTITIFGPANMRTAVAVGSEGSVEKVGFTFCFGTPIAFRKQLTELTLDASGQVSTEWTVSGQAFDNKYVQGVVKLASGPGAPLAQTDCEVLTVFP